VFDYEERIRSLTKAFVDERDPEKIKALAEELIRLLSLEKKPWLMRNQELPE
jgi:hypothetical protein